MSKKYKKMRNKLRDMLRPFYNNYIYSLVNNPTDQSEYLEKVHRILTSSFEIHIDVIKNRIKNNVPKEYQNNSYELVCMVAITKATKFYIYNNYSDAYNDYIHMLEITNTHVNENVIYKYYKLIDNANNLVKVDENTNVDMILNDIDELDWKYIIIAISPYSPIFKNKLMRNIYLITHSEFTAMRENGIEYAEIKYQK